MKRFIIALLIPLLAVVTVQICLKNPKTREIFTDIESYENINYGGLVQNDGVEIQFTKQGTEPLELYFNGEKIEKFDTDVLCVKVQCDGIFEIKNNSNRVVTVTATCGTKGIIKNIINTEFNRGISPVCEININ